MAGDDRAVVDRPADLFHYATRDFAEEILDDPGSAYAEINHGLYGPGFYALDLSPDAAAGGDLDLRWECFDDSRPDHPMDGLLVLEADLAVPPFEHAGAHIWLQPQEP